jgi:hypothetical protein
MHMCIYSLCIKTHAPFIHMTINLEILKHNAKHKLLRWRNVMHWKNLDSNLVTSMNYMLDDTIYIIF